jgi:hypothetical protein
MGTPKSKKRGLRNNRRIQVLSINMYEFLSYCFDIDQGLNAMSGLTRRRLI